MKLATLLLFSLSIGLLSCEVDVPLDSSDNICNELAQVRAHAVPAVIKGEEINLSADEVENAYYSWIGPNNFQSYHRDPNVTSYAEYSHEGMYYVTVSNPDCTTKVDSVYVQVNFPQGTPPCSLTNNHANFNSDLIIGNQSYNFVSFGGGIGGYQITGNSSNGDMRITMSNYWATHELRDGIYYTSSNQLPQALDAVHILSVNLGMLWYAQPNKPVYISHVNGKARVSFCAVPFTANNGSNTYTANVSTQITQP